MPLNIPAFSGLVQPHAATSASADRRPEDAGFAQILDRVTAPARGIPAASENATPGPQAKPSAELELERDVEPVVETPVEAEVPVDAALLTDLVQALGALQIAISSGTPPTPALVGELGDIADTLSALLPQGKAMKDGPPNGFLNQLGEKLGDFAAALAETGEELSPKLEALSKKLTSLDSQLLEKLGMSPAAETEVNELLAEIAKLEPPRARADLALAARSAVQHSLPLPTIDAVPSASAQGPAIEGEASEPTSIDRGVAEAAPKIVPGQQASQSAALLQPKAPAAQNQAALDLVASAELRPVTDEHKTEVAAGEQSTKPETETRTATQAQPEAQLRRAGVAAGKDKGPDLLLDAGQAAQPGAQGAVRIEAPGARAVAAAYGTQQAQLNVPQLAFDMTRQIQAGNSQFQIRLDPADLGRIDVKLDIDASGGATARLIVEKSETLDLLQRDQRTLERALAQAGLDSSRTSLEFSLRQHGHDQRQGQPGFEAANSEQLKNASPDMPPVAALYRGSVSASGVNIFA